MSIAYSHILLATDLQQENKMVADKAKALAELHQARLSLIHVVEAIPLYYGNELVLPETQEIELQLVEQARQQMAHLCQVLNLAEACGHVETGSTSFEITEFARNHDVDLIVLGSHSRHGLAYLLGSTAKKLVKNALCDVLAVHVK